MGGSSTTLLTSQIGDYIDSGLKILYITYPPGAGNRSQVHTVAGWRRSAHFEQRHHTIITLYSPQSGVKISYYTITSFAVKRTHDLSIDLAIIIVGGDVINIYLIVGLSGQKV